VRRLLQSKYWIYALFLLLTYIPPAPKEIGWREAVYILLFSSAFLLWLGRGLLRGKVSLHPSLCTWAILSFLWICVWSYPVAMGNGVELKKWLRGVAPFLNLAIYFVVVDEFRKKDVEILLKVLIISAALFAYGTLMVYFVKEKLWIPKYYPGFGAYFVWRVTRIYSPSTISYPVWGVVICFLLSLFSRGWKRLGLFFLALFMLLAVVVTYSRSMLLALLIGASVAVLWITREGRWKAIRLGKGTILLFILSLLFLLFVGLKTGTLTIAVERIGAAVKAAFGRRSVVADYNISSRLQEWRMGLKLFLESPFWGKGLGFPFWILLDAGFPGYPLFKWFKVSYVHNFFLYFLTFTGILGTVPYLLLLFGGFWEFSRIWRREEILPLSFGIILTVTVAYSLFFAEYRLNTYNLLLGATLGALVRLRKGDNGMG